MSEQRYDLIFRGELARGAELAQAKKNIAHLFKINESKVEQLFSGKEIALKKGVDFATGNKYRVAIKKAGCVVELREQKPAANTAGKAVFNVPGQAPEKTAKTASAAAATGTKPVAKPAQAAAQQPVAQQPAPEPALQGSSADSGETKISLAPAGGDLLKDNEKTKFEARDVDVSALSVKDAGGDLLNDAEKDSFVARDIALEASLAPAGEQLLNDDERESQDPVEVDTSALSVAEAGADLGQEKTQKKELQPDTSHLSLQ
ncbi:hypothetical protein [Agaribacterium haliotis]|uniref:hypothetical protein n=1 Tax=Agaribacterium haliotis TaxID=2013869 RepID=UPI000BB589AF|nr:hypothetical protein [Agaribacterium haliotis]